MKRTPMPPTAKPLRRAPLMRAANLSQSPTRARAKRTPRRQAETLLGRDAAGMGTCARCGRFGPVNGHERIGRSQGGDPTKPDCLLDAACNTWCEDNPLGAAWAGWKVSRLNPREPYLRANEARRVDGSVHVFEEATS